MDRARSSTRKVGIGSMDDEVDADVGTAPARRRTPREAPEGRNGGDGLDVGRTRADVGTASVLTRGAVPLRVDAGTNGVADAAARTPLADIVKNAKARWLRNTEVCDALLNYVAYGFEASAEAPMKPRAGTLYLINRRVVRFFRKDGHNWQKKKDGKTVTRDARKVEGWDGGALELLLHALRG